MSTRKCSVSSCNEALSDKIRLFKFPDAVFDKDLIQINAPDLDIEHAKSAR